MPNNYIQASGGYKSSSFTREKARSRGDAVISDKMFSVTKYIYLHRWIEELITVATPHYLLPGNFNMHLSHYLSSQTSALLVLQVLLEATQCPSILEQKNPYFQGRNGFPFNYLCYVNRCRIQGKIFWSTFLNWENKIQHSFVTKRRNVSKQEQEGPFLPCNETENITS